MSKIIISCKNCGREKYHNAKGLCRTCYKKLNGRIIICKDCGNTEKHEAFNLCRKCYLKWKSKTILGVLNNIYNNMKYRSKLNKRKKILTKKQFLSFAATSNFNDLFLTWKNSNYKFKYHPSIDRINNKKGYVKGNLQFLTCSENTKKKLDDDVDNGHRIKMIKDNKIYYFSSMKSCSRFLNKSQEYTRHIIEKYITSSLNITELIKVSQQEYKNNLYLDPTL